MQITPISAPTKKLAQSILSTDLSLKLNNVTGWDGIALAAADLGTQHFCVLKNDTGTQIEIIEIDPATIASASITILKRGLKYNGEQTEVAGNKYNWAANETSVSIGTDVPQLLRQYITVADAQTISGVKTFSASPIVPTPSSANQAATRGYVDGVAIAGGADASTTVKGISKLSVAPALATNPISVGDNDPRLPTTDEKAAMVGTSGAPSAANKFVTNDDTDGTGDVVRKSLIEAMEVSYFGTGADGAGVISVDTNLSKDMYYSSLTVDASKVLNTANFRVFVSGTTTVSGTIKNNGLTGNNGGNGGNATGGGYGGGGGGGASGGQGGGIVALYSKHIVVNIGGAIKGLGGAGGIGGNGGNGASSTGAGVSGTGGGGGAAVAAVSGATLAGTVASGAGAAGGNTATQGSLASKAATLANSIGVNGAVAGGGGTGGGLSNARAADTASLRTLPDLMPYIPQFAISLHTFRNSTTAYMVGSAQANGGSGGGGGATDGAAGNSGGGGGGGGGAGGTGGIIVLIYKTLTNNGSISVAGGAGGNGGTGGNPGGTGTAGSAGGNGAAGTTGVIYQIQI